MIVTVDDELEPVGENIVEVPALKELSHDLIVESIRDQIEYPFTSHSNFVSTFTEKFEEDLERIEGIDDDETREIKLTATDFYTDVLKMIDRKFKLNLDFDMIAELNINGIKTLCEGIYEFFIVGYSRNVSKYLLKLILEFKDTIVFEVLSTRKGRDVSTLSYRKKVEDKNFAVLLSNINVAIDYVKSLSVSPDDFTDYFNTDRFDITVLNYAVEKFLITGNFTNRFIEPIFDDFNNDIYDQVVSEIQEGLYHRYEKLKERGEIET